MARAKAQTEQFERDFWSGALLASYSWRSVVLMNVLPGFVPEGTFSVTGPFSVGTGTLAPSAASG